MSSGTLWSLLLVTVLAASGLAAELWWFEQPAIAGKTAAAVADAGDPAPALPVLKPVELPELESLSHTIERPLFREDRRPPKEMVDTPSVEVKPVVASLPAIALNLVAIVSVGDNRSAYLSDPSNGKVHRVQAGATLSGWEIQAIDDEFVSLSRSGKPQKLTLRHFKPIPARKKKRAVRKRAVSRANQGADGQAQTDAQADGEESEKLEQRRARRLRLQERRKRKNLQNQNMTN